MKKTSINKKKLIIKKNKLIKEGWAEVAGDIATDGSWTKIAKTALGGAYEAFKRNWNTCVVLPWKLINAFADGKSLENVMNEWESRDKDLKAKQINIIKNTGVSDTVEAFVGVCNPGALMFQKFCEWEDADMKRRFKSGSTSIWDNTIGRRYPELKIGKDEDMERKSSAKIVYSNFVITVCKAINISIKQRKIDSLDEFNKSSLSLTKAIAESNAKSIDNTRYRNFFKYLLNSLKSNSTVITKSSGYTYTSFIEKNSKLKSQIDIIEVNLFKEISEKGISIDKAAKILMANSISQSLESIGDFIANSKGLLKDFEDFLKSSPTASKETEKDSDSESQEKLNTGVSESIKNKTLILNNNNMFIKNLESISEISRRKQKKAEKAFMDIMTNYYFAHLSILFSAKSIIINHLVVMKYSNSYRIYYEAIDNFKNNKYEVSNIKPEFEAGELTKYISLLDLIEDYISNIDKNLLSKEDNLSKDLIDDFKKNKLDGKSIIDYFNSIFNVKDNKEIDNMINDFARLTVGENVGDDVVAKKIEKIKNNLDEKDIKDINDVLVSAGTVRAWEDMINKGNVEKQITEISNAQKNIIEIQGRMAKILSAKMVKKIKATLPAFFAQCIDLINKKEIINLKKYSDIISKINDIDFDDIAKSLEEEASRIISIADSKKTDVDSDSGNDEDVTDVSSEKALAVIIDSNEEEV